MECGIREYDLYFAFVNTYVPHTLRNLYALYQTFYVKGGKAADEYLRKKIGSPDWDVMFYIPNGEFASKMREVHTHTFTTLNSFLTEFTNSMNATLVFKETKYNEPGKPELPMFQYGIKQGECELLFLDVVFTTHNFPGCSVRGGIPYQKRRALLEDIEVILNDRIAQVVEMQTYSDLYTKSFPTAISNQIHTIDKKITKLFEKIAEQSKTCENSEKLLERIELLQEYEQEKAKVLSYENYLLFIQMKQMELEKIQKRNLTQKRRNRLRLQTHTRLSSKRAYSRRRSSKRPTKRATI
jgi:hypothetical protein